MQKIIIFLTILCSAYMAKAEDFALQYTGNNSNVSFIGKVNSTTLTMKSRYGHQVCDVHNFRQRQNRIRFRFDNCIINGAANPTQCKFKLRRNGETYNGTAECSHYIPGDTQYNASMNTITGAERIEKYGFHETGNNTNNTLVGNLNLRNNKVLLGHGAGRLTCEVENVYENGDRIMFDFTSCLNNGTYNPTTCHYDLSKHRGPIYSGEGTCTHYFPGDTHYLAGLSRITGPRLGQIYDITNIGNRTRMEYNGEVDMDERILITRSFQGTMRCEVREILERRRRLIFNTRNCTFNGVPNITSCHYDLKKRGGIFEGETICSNYHPGDTHYETEAE